MTAKVLQLHPTKPSLSKKRYDSQQWMDLIHEGLLLQLRNGVKIKHIATATNLSPNTISKMIYEPTPYKRMSTMVAILLYLGYELYAEKTPNKK